MNLEDFQARFESILENKRTFVIYKGAKNNIYILNDCDVENLYNLCLEGMGEL